MIRGIFLLFHSLIVGLLIITPITFISINTWNWTNGLFVNLEKQIGSYVLSHVWRVIMGVEQYHGLCDVPWNPMCDSVVFITWIQQRRNQKRIETKKSKEKRNSTLKNTLVKDLCIIIYKWLGYNGAFGSFSPFNRIFLSL